MTYSLGTGGSSMCYNARYQCTTYFWEKPWHACLSELVSLNFLRNVSTAYWLLSGSPCLWHLLQTSWSLWGFPIISNSYSSVKPLLYLLTDELISPISILSPLHSILWKVLQMSDIKILYPLNFIDFTQFIYHL